jgi:hypothetical protein
MATVKNQILSVWEVMYQDFQNTLHYFISFYKQAQTVAYPRSLFSTKEHSRKSPRGKYPTRKGKGSARQAPRRACFKWCVSRWNAMLDECPTYHTPFRVGSKKQIWDAKQAQGWPKTYYNLFMSCCLDHCFPLLNENQVDDTCWPCPEVQAGNAWAAGESAAGCLGNVADYTTRTGTSIDGIYGISWNHIETITINPGGTPPIQE